MECVRKAREASQLNSTSESPTLAKLWPHSTLRGGGVHGVFTCNSTEPRPPPAKVWTLLVRLRAACTSALDAHGRTGASHANATSRKGAVLFTVASCVANLETYLHDCTPPWTYSAVPTTGTVLAAAGSTKMCQAWNHRTRMLFDKRCHLG
jgi:hypothetical protein